MDDEVKQAVEEFFEAYPLRRYDKGHVLIHPKEPLKSVYYLIEGNVIEYDISSMGNEVIVNSFKPRAFFPMSMAINRTLNYYIFEASTPIVVREAPPQKVVEFLGNNPKVTFDLLGRVYHGTDGLLRRMAHLMGGNARSRLIFELLNAAYRFGSRESTGGNVVPLTEGDLAKRSGLSRETVNRTMHTLKGEGLVKSQRGSIAIISMTELELALGSEL